MALKSNGYATWQEALTALVQENGIEDSELGDIARRARAGRHIRWEPTELSISLQVQDLIIEDLEAEIVRLRMAAGEVEPTDRA